MSGDFRPRLFWTGDFERQSVISDGVRWNRTVISDGVRWIRLPRWIRTVISDGVRWIRTPNSVVFYITILVLISLISDGDHQVRNGRSPKSSTVFKSLIEYPPLIWEWISRDKEHVVGGDGHDVDLYCVLSPPDLTSFYLSQRWPTLPVWRRLVASLMPNLIYLFSTGFPHLILSDAYLLFLITRVVLC